MQAFLEKNHKAIVGLILAFVLVVSTLNAWWDTAIFDETAHIPAGYSYLRYHDMRLNPEHPPLIKDLAAIPLLFMNLNFDTDAKFWTTDVNGQWEAGHNLLWQMGNDADQIVFWSRLPIVLLSLLLGWFIFKWTREIAGIIAGLFALVLFAFDPNILGHNHFVTTDIGIVAFLVFSFYYFLKFVKDPTWKNVAIGGVFLGMLQLAKFSSIMAFPIFGLILFIYPFTKKTRNPKKSLVAFRFKKLGEYLGKGIIAFLISLVVVWVVYFFNTYSMPGEVLAKTIDFYFSPTDTANLKNIYTNHALHSLNSHAFTRPMSEYILGIAMVFKRVAGGNGAYFMGQVSGNAFPAYFPTVFLIKEPLPNLLFMLSAILFSFWGIFQNISASFKKNCREKMRQLSEFFRHNVSSIAMLSFVFLYSYISITGNLNIGFRHLFPILPFVYILTAKTIFGFLKKIDHPHTRLIFNTGLSAISAILILGTIGAYPYYMSYFNPAGGGSKNGYQYVTDSNADWGQDMRRLQKWIESYNKTCRPTEVTETGAVFTSCIPPKTNQGRYSSHLMNTYGPIEKIRVDYFGGADIQYYLGDHYQKWWDANRPVEAGWYAISTNFLQGSLYDTTKADNTTYRWIPALGLKPVHQVGTSILIYYVTPEQAEKISNSPNF